jgi:hypothetical protein
VQAENEFSFLCRDQAGGERILHQLGALAEIEEAVVEHYASLREPAYKPELQKQPFRDRGWTTEKRVPPFSPTWDFLRIGDRYDIFKEFELSGQVFGVAIEMERWEIHQDLLRFRRGFERGLIGCGVILTEGPGCLAYIYDHARHLSEPLFGSIPVLYCAPDGPGLPQVCK